MATNSYYLVKPTTGRVTALGIFLFGPAGLSKSHRGILDHSLQAPLYSQVCQGKDLQFRQNKDFQQCVACR